MSDPKLHISRECALLYAEWVAGNYADVLDVTSGRSVTAAQFNQYPRLTILNGAGSVSTWPSSTPRTVQRISLA